MSDEEILKRIKSLVLEIDTNAQVILFGSRARKEATLESDWDILITTELAHGLKTEQRFRHQLFYLELEAGISISTFVFNREMWNTNAKGMPLFESISQEGITV
jgi:predicted nucleotidyltransferase